MPKITIITVVKDDLDGLRITAASISQLKSNDFEWVIVDGFSSDGSYDFAQTLLISDQISLIQVEAVGIYNAMNSGLNVARGDWVWHLNAGDVILEDTIIQKIIMKTNDLPNLAVIGMSVIYLSHLGYVFSISRPEVIERSYSVEARFHHQGAILNRKIALALGGYDEKMRLASDGKLLDKMIQKGSYLIHPIAAVGFEMGGASSQNFTKTLEEISSYREDSSSSRSVAKLIFKNLLRETVLKFERSLFLRYLVIPYLIIRQNRIIKRNKDVNFSILNKSDQLITVEVLSSSDLNQKYLDCVRFYIQSWNTYPTLSGIKYIPKVLIIAKKIPTSLEDLSEYLKVVDPFDLPPSFVAQAGRLAETKNSIADYVMTSDIDMLPISMAFENRLISRTRKVPESFFILRDVLAPGQYPICYNLATPKTWGELLANTFPRMESKQILGSFLNSSGGVDQYDGIHGGVGWTLDQEMLWNMIKSDKNGFKVVRFNDLETRHRRLDRARYRGAIKWLISPLILFPFFHDYHIHHPVQNNQKYLRLVITLRNFRLRMYRV